MLHVRSYESCALYNSLSVGCSLWAGYFHYLYEILDFRPNPEGSIVRTVFEINCSLRFTKIIEREQIQPAQPTNTISAALKLISMLYN